MDEPEVEEPAEQSARYLDTVDAERWPSGPN